ncbi:DNA methylase [Lentzea sp. NPDC034063]|uniref:DNA methylase n=1 Tax=unclassified Lentzea TaxID=2643253 RepID=UPI0033DF340B
MPDTETDLERVPPAVAARTIATYTRLGDLVLDPDCGAGTVLSEALRAGRQAFGLTADRRWWTLARANVSAAKVAGALRDGSVLDARPKALEAVRAAGLSGRVGLVLTAVRTASGRTADPGDDPIKSTIADLTTTLRCCEPLLCSGGHVAVVAQPYRGSDDFLVDLTTRLIAASAAAGLVLVDRCIALTAELRDSRLVTRASLAERRRASRTSGFPTSLVAHHEVLVFQRAHDVELAALAVEVDAPGWRRAA